MDYLKTIIVGIPLLMASVASGENVDTGLSEMAQQGLNPGSPRNVSKLAVSLAIRGLQRW